MYCAAKSLMYNYCFAGHPSFLPQFPVMCLLSAIKAEKKTNIGFIVGPVDCIILPFLLIFCPPFVILISCLIAMSLRAHSEM